ncbi:MAG: ABC transporter ATP-binding protein, partial [Candidatus Binatia bacterium]
LVDGMSAGPEQGGAVKAALWAFIGLIVVENVLWRASGWLGCRTTIAVGRDIRLDLFSHLSGHSMRFFSERFGGALGHRVTGTAGRFGALVNTMVWRIAPPCVEFLGALIVFTTVNGYMALAMTAFVVMVTIGLAITGERSQPLHQDYANKAGEAGGDIVDVVSNIWTVKAFSAVGLERNRLKGTFDREADAQARSWMHMERTRVAHDVLLSLMAAAMLTWAVTLWTESMITSGDVVVMSALTFRILHGSRDLALSWVDIVQHMSFIRETLAEIGKPHEVADAPLATELPVIRGEIALKNVSFGYSGGPTIIKEFSLDIPQGLKVGIVGPSGAGKSTLLCLIQRLHDVERGDILIDGRSVKSVTQDSLRSALGVVPQDVALFHRSVMENIRVARPRASDEEVRAAARAAHCDGFISELQHGYDTFVGERGTKLSGGQRQRIGIARVFLKDPPIVLLDEATSSLDTATEQEIQRELSSLMEGRTVLAVAHRFSTISEFDRIVVIEDGRIVEDGAPVELLKSSRGIYTAMWQRQAIWSADTSRELVET